MAHKISRREFMRQAGLSSLSLLTPYLLSSTRPLTRLATAQRPPEEVFGLSVASGDPTPSGIILWTRINETVWQADESLTFEVATDPEFLNLAAQGSVAGVDFGPERDHTVKIDLDGALAAGTVYYYRFIYQEVSSQVGRCRTLPAGDSTPDSLALGVLTCQDFGSGYYGALHHLAQEEVDYIIHLGDFIYEGGDSTLPGHELNLPSGASKAINLEDYRYLYRSYRSDPFLQEVSAQHPFIVIWDDHEFANNNYWDYDLDAPQAPGHPLHPDPVALTQLKLDAMRAWSEYIPARLAINPDATHPHHYYQLHRSFTYGNLARLFMTDERSYRMAQPPRDDPDPIYRTMLGDATRVGPGNQLEWLINGMLQAEAEDVTWKVWGNEVLFMPLVLPRPEQGDPIPLNTDAWDGYTDERRLIAQALQFHLFPRQGVRNLVVLTGDMHMYLAGYIKVDYTQPNFTAPWNNMIGVEFMTSSLTSANGGDVLPPDFPADGERLVKLLNPHIRFFNPIYSGYCVVTFTPDECTYTAYQVPKDVNSGDVPKTILQKYRVPVNQVRLIDITPT